MWRSVIYRFQVKNKVKFPSIQRRTVRSTWRATLSVASPQEEGQSAGGTVPHRGRSSLDFQVSGASTSPRPPACLTATPSLTTASTLSWPTTRLLAVSAREVPSIQISQDSFQPRHRIVYLQGIAIVPARRRRLIIKSALLTVVITQIFSLTQCRLGCVPSRPGSYSWIRRTVFILSGRSTSD